MKKKTTELDSSGSGQGPVVDVFDNATDPSAYGKGEEFIDLLLHKVTYKRKITQNSTHGLL
jgi:hypothetical protein